MIQGTSEGLGAGEAATASLLGMCPPSTVMEPASKSKGHLLTAITSTVHI